MGNSETKEVDLQKLLVQQLESLKQAGLAELPIGATSPDFDFDDVADAAGIRAAAPPAPTAAAATSQRPAPPASKPAAPATPAPESQPPAINITDSWGEKVAGSERPAALEIVNNEVRNCSLCSDLSSNRTQTVFGVGDPSARLVLVGEGPGADEDKQGEPFVGAAGGMLNKILTACTIERNDIYILNTVKCRPPMNRNPTDREIRNCWNYLERQLEIIQPEFILCLGSVAAKSMLQTTQSLGRLRGRFHDWKGARLLVTYHPAYLLRNEGAKRHVWEDMKLLMKEMGIKLPKR